MDVICEAGLVNVGGDAVEAEEEPNSCSSLPNIMDADINAIVECPSAKANHAQSSCTSDCSVACCRDHNDMRIVNLSSTRS